MVFINDLERGLFVKKIFKWYYKFFLNDILNDITYYISSEWYPAGVSNSCDGLTEIIWLAKGVKSLIIHTLGWGTLRVVWAKVGGSYKKGGLQPLKLELQLQRTAPASEKNYSRPKGEEKASICNLWRRKGNQHLTTEEEKLDLCREWASGPVSGIAWQEHQKPWTWCL